MQSKITLTITEIKRKKQIKIDLARARRQRIKKEKILKTMETKKNCKMLDL